MGLKYLLDTNILSELAKPQPNANVQQQLAQHYPACCTAVTVWHELHYGVQRLPESKRKLALTEFLKQLENNGLPILDYNKVAALWLAEQRAMLSQQGIVVPYQDGEIAAIAAAHGLTLITRNFKDFVMYSDLAVENWFELKS